MSDAPQYLTQEKCDELKKELEQLKSVRRREVAEHLEYAKSLGDLAENAEYHEAREEQANVEDRIKKLEALLAGAVIMELRHTELVDIGSTVTLQKAGASAGATYKVVGSEEADLGKGKLSYNSPLGQAMLGKRKGEEFTAKTPSGEVRYMITDIE
ncbi:MAG: transcription elongation factor GreA [bacterium]|nr:transcription elongation factor GreA [bacterium]